MDDCYPSAMDLLVATDASFAPFEWMGMGAVKVEEQEMDDHRGDLTNWEYLTQTFDQENFDDDEANIPVKTSDGTQQHEVPATSTSHDFTPHQESQQQALPSTPKWDEWTSTLPHHDSSPRSDDYSDVFDDSKDESMHKPEEPPFMDLGLPEAGSSLFKQSLLCPSFMPPVFVPFGDFPSVSLMDSSMAHPPSFFHLAGPCWMGKESLNVEPNPMIVAPEPSMDCIAAPFQFQPHLLETTDMTLAGLMRSYKSRKNRLEDAWNGTCKRVKVDLKAPECPLLLKENVTVRADEDDLSPKVNKKGANHPSKRSDMSPATTEPNPKASAGTTSSPVQQPIQKMCLPMTAYNYFFRNERENIVKGMKHPDDPIPPPCLDFSPAKQDELLHQHWYIDPYKEKRQHRSSHGCISFRTLSKVIAERWKELPRDGRVFYRQVAQADQDQYDIFLPPEQRLRRSTTSTSGTGSTC